MVEFLFSWGLFTVKALTLVLCLALGIGAVIMLSLRGRQQSRDEGEIDVRLLNSELEDMRNVLSDALLDDVALTERLRVEKEEAKRQRKEDKRAAKALRKNNRHGGETRPAEIRKRSVYVLDFDGDAEASAVDDLRQCLNAIFGVADAKDEVVVRLESPGGMVHSYGLAAAQLERVRRAGIPLTICVDRVAASGGYMMASVANKIIASPFAYIGSIGVVAEVPNVHRLLQRIDVDYEVLTAGESKRTMTVFGENTDAGRKKFKEDLETIHQSFKDHIAEHRRQLDVAKVSTGEVWLGKAAHELGLIDEVGTSDQYLLEQTKEAKVLLIRYRHKKSFIEQMGIESMLSRIAQKALSQLRAPFFR